MVNNRGNKNNLSEQNQSVATKLIYRNKTNLSRQTKIKKTILFKGNKQGHSFLVQGPIRTFFFQDTLEIGHGVGRVI